MEKKPQEFTTIEQQIELLKSRNLVFKSEKNAKIILESYGYYEIINGYKDFYVEKTNSTERYRDGITFEQIASLYSLDHSIRNQLIVTLLDLESHLRAATSYVIAESFSSTQSEYLKFSNYQNRSTKYKRFSLGSILDKFNKVAHSSKEPIKYHMDTYGNVPPWVLLKGIYLSDLVNFIRLLKPNEKEKLIHKIYSIPVELIDTHLKNFFTDTLFMCLEYRNLAAHGDRIYNHIPKSIIRVTSDSEKELSELIPNFNHINNSHSLGTLIYALSLFKKQEYVHSLQQVIEKEIKRHCSAYPDDLEYLLDSVGIASMVTITRI